MVLDTIKDLGFKYATRSGVSISKNDIVTPPEKAAILADYEKRVALADVPFFLHGTNAFGEGVGEALTTLELPPAWYLVLVPPVAVRVGAAFEVGLALAALAAGLVNPFTGSASAFGSGDARSGGGRRDREGYIWIDGMRAWTMDFTNQKFSGVQ